MNELSSDLAKAILSPYNIGELRKAIEHMNPDIPVFRFQYGNIEGMCDWKRKDTWKQWLRKEKAKEK
jgi:hypothetical protein